MVLPAELLQVTYAGELREYLAGHYSELTVVTFRRLVFDGIQQETVLLLGIRSDGGPGLISFVELDSAADLTTERLAAAEPTVADLDHAAREVDRSTTCRRASSG